VERRRAQLGTGRQTKGLSLPCLANVCTGRAGVREGVCVHTSTSRPRRRLERRQRHGVWANEQGNPERKERRAGARGGDSSSTYKKKHPSLAEGRHHTV
jgi:hypothetical protein